MDEGRCGGSSLDQACSRAQLSGFGAALELLSSAPAVERSPWRKRGLERPRMAGGKGKLGGAGPGFLEVMVSNRGCQGCSFWVTQLSAPVCVIAVSRVGCSINECLPLLL